MYNVYMTSCTYSSWAHCKIIPMSLNVNASAISYVSLVNYRKPLYNSLVGVQFSIYLSPEGKCLLWRCHLVEPPHRHVTPSASRLPYCCMLVNNNNMSVTTSTLHCTRACKSPYHYSFKLEITENIVLTSVWRKLFWIRMESILPGWGGILPWGRMHPTCR